MLKYGINQQNSLLDFTDEQIYASTGIENWKNKYNSLSKILNRHGVFAYDEAGLYCVDKLALTYTSKYNHLFYSYPDLFVDSDFNTRFNIDGDLVLISNRGKEHQYHKLYYIELYGKIVGELFVHKTSDVKLSRIQISNEILYTDSVVNIIKYLVDVSQKLQLQFANYCNYEVALDSGHNYYRDLTLIYYQSDFCSSSVHEAHHSEPVYTFYGKKRLCNHTVDINNTSLGTLSFGSKNSASWVKVYPKTPDAETKGKKYISKLHNEFFGDGRMVYRVEACARSEFFTASKPFGKRHYDLIDLILPNKLKCNFYTIIGDKLKFRKISASGWDSNRNAIFETVEVVKSPENENYFCTIIPQDESINIPNHEIDEIKELTYLFLRGKVSCLSVCSYISSTLKEYDYQKHRNLILGIEKAKRNFKGVTKPVKRAKLNRLMALLKTAPQNKKISKFRLYLLVLL